MHTTTKPGTRNSERPATAGHRSPLRTPHRGTRFAGRLRTPHSALRTAFTLTELLIVIAIIGIMTGLGLSALAGATELAREQRTRSIIAKIDQLIMERYESYRTRAVPIRVPPAILALPQGNRVAAQMRLNALRDLMRMELPERVSDVVDPPCDYDPRSGSTLFMRSPSLRNSYVRQAQRNCGGPTNWTTNWKAAHQGAECLYLIVSSMHDGDKNAIDFFSSDEIGDTDGDGMKEILDAWGNPLLFLRWPAGYTIEQPGEDATWGTSNSTDPTNFDPNTSATKDFNFPLTTQTRDFGAAPDPFDPIKVGFFSGYTPCYALRPLIASAGRDKDFDIVTDYKSTTSTSLFHYSPVSSPTDNNAPNPYILITVTINGTALDFPIGSPADMNDDSTNNFADNITNHYQQTP